MTIDREKFDLEYRKLMRQIAETPENSNEIPEQWHSTAAFVELLNRKLFGPRPKK